MKIKLTLACTAVVVFLSSFTPTVKASSPLGPDLPLIGDATLAFKLDKAGRIAAETGNIHEAKMDYQQALAACFTDETAELGVARCMAAEGDLETAVTYYRKAVYGHLEDDNIDLLTEYILVLDQDDQGQEAISLYDRVADLCKKGYAVNKMDVPLPVFRLDGSDYNSLRLQAMTHLIRAMNSGNGDDKRIMFEMQKAISLAPDAFIVHFYKSVLVSQIDKSGTEGSLQQDLHKAIQLGDAKISAAKPGVTILR